MISTWAPTRVGLRELRPLRLSRSDLFRGLYRNKSTGTLHERIRAVVVLPMMRVRTRECP